MTMPLKPRTSDTDAALDGVLDALDGAGFAAPFDDAASNRDALARALVTAAIDHELRIRIDSKAR